MRERNFEVPVDLMIEFVKIMEEQEFDNVIEGVTEDGEILVRVDYEPEQKAVINKLHDLIDTYHENHEDDEDNEDEDDNNEENES
jgi:hypothetical protein